MTMAQTVTDPLLLEACVRDELNVTAPRYCISSSVPDNRDLGCKNQTKSLVCEVSVQVCASIIPDALRMIMLETTNLTVTKQC